MKKINLYQLRIPNNDELNGYCLLDEGEFYIEWTAYPSFRDFEKQVYKYLDNLKVSQVKAYYDDVHLFIDQGGYYNLAKKSLSYYAKKNLNIKDKNIAMPDPTFINPDDVVEFTRLIKGNVEFWLRTLRGKLGINKEGTNNF